MPACALWLRVSTAEQTSQNQRAVLEEFAARRGYTVVHVYDVEASAWKGKQHKALDDAALRAHRSEFSALFVWAIDRLSREGIEATLRTVGTFTRAGCRIISHQEPWAELEGATAELMVSIMAWMARQESERRSERTLAGLARAKAQGVTLGRRASTRNLGRERKFRELAALVASKALSRELAAKELKVRTETFRAAYSAWEASQVAQAA